MLAFRLRETGYVKGSGEGHSEILTQFDCIPDKFEHCVAQPSLSGIFPAHIPSRKMWVGRRHCSRGAVNFFTDELKLKRKWSLMSGALN